MHREIVKILAFVVLRRTIVCAPEMIVVPWDKIVFGCSRVMNVALIV